MSQNLPTITRIYMKILYYQSLVGAVIPKRGLEGINVVIQISVK